ncbi:Ig-like domain-containing protein, partial [Janthinobacterium psychrotolerans]
TGTAEAGSTVTLYDTDGTTVLGTAVATGGVWSITSSALASGAHSLSVKAADAAGNTSVASPALAISIDATAPAAPGAPVLAAASDSGSSNTDGITSVTTPTITGTAEAGSLVTLYDTDGTTVLGTATAAGGVWSITSSALAIGAHSLSVKAVDAAGNLSPSSAVLSITINTVDTIDTTAPAAPSVPVLAAASDSGSANTDGLTSVTTPTVTGTAEAGSLVTLYDTDGTTVLGTTTAAGGVWSITSSTLAAGAHSLTVKAVDAAGNRSAASPSLTITIDSTAPTAPATPVLAAASDSGASNADGITSVNRPTISGRAEAGSTVTLLGTDGVTTLGNATADANGNWRITSNLLADGVHSLTVKAFDAAGNSSVASAALTVTIDTTAPAAPAPPVLAAASDNGASDSDGITSVTTPTITGRAEAGSTVTLYDSDGATVLGTVLAAANGNWSITSSTLADGVHSLSVRATDQAGNRSVASQVLSVNIDTAAPAAPATPVLLAASDSGASSADGVTSVNRPTITGRAEAGSTITLYDTDGVTNVGTALAAANGNWNISSSQLADGVHSLTVRATDPAGNRSAASPALTITIDTTAPTAPATPALASSSDSGTSNSDGVTSVNRPNITGRAEAGSTVTLLDTDGLTVLGTAVAAANGNWSITSSTLADGSHSLSVRATDPAGNRSAASPVLSVIIDTAVPATPAAPVLAAASDNGASTTDGITSVTTPTVSGRAQPGATVTLYDTDGVSVLGSAVVNASGAWSITSRALTDGNHQLSTKTTSSTGIVSAASTALAISIDTTAPAAPAAPVLAQASDSGVANGDGVTNVARPTITGRGEPGAIATLFDTDGITVLGRASVDAGGAWSITSSLLADGVHRLSARIADAAGNTSAASTALTVVVDATAPAAAGTPRLVDGNSTTTLVTTPQLSGAAEPNSTVVVFSDGAAAGQVLADANGNWTLTLQLSLGAHQITAGAIDAAGNVGAVSAPLALTVLTPPPPVTAPVVPAPTTAPLVPVAVATAPQAAAPNTPPIREAATGVTGTSPISAAVNQASGSQFASAAATGSTSSTTTGNASLATATGSTAATASGSTSFTPITAPTATDGAVTTPKATAAVTVQGTGTGTARDTATLPATGTGTGTAAAAATTAANPAAAPATTAVTAVTAATSVTAATAPAAVAQLAAGATLVLNREIGSVSVPIEAQQGLAYAIPRDTFVSASGVAPTLTATLADGSPLPAWVRFDAVTGTFSGVPPRGETVSLDIVVTARDGAGNTAKAEFSLKGDTVVKDGKPPQAALHGKHLLQALGLHRAAAAVDDAGATTAGAAADDGESGEGSDGGTAVLADAGVGTEATNAQAGALSTQLSREAQRFLQEASATLRHLTRL